MRSYLSLILITKGTIMLLVQVLLQPYLCSRVNNQVTCWDLTWVLFWSVRELLCYLFRSYSSLISVALIYQVTCWALTPIFFSSLWQLLFNLLGSYSSLIFCPRVNCQIICWDLTRVLFSSIRKLCYYAHSDLTLVLFLALM